MDKKQVKIPKFIWVLVGILVVSIIFLIAVQMPFSQKIETYNKDHQSAESQISQYAYYLKNAETITAAVEKTEAECSEKNEKLTVDPNKTVDDIRDLLAKHEMDLTTLNITEGVPDDQGGVSASGDPLYVSTLITTYKLLQPRRFCVPQNIRKSSRLTRRYCARIPRSHGPCAMQNKRIDVSDVPGLLCFLLPAHPIGREKF